MTELTPGQVEKWAGDEVCARRWEKATSDALRNSAVMPGYYNEYLLHAHALHLQQQAEIARLTALIDEHNAKLESQCIERHSHTGSLCAKYERLGWICNKCPRRHMIDTQDGVK